MPFSLPGFFPQKKRGSMTNKQILKSIKALARDECENYSRGDCLMTDERCHLVNPNYGSIHDGAIDCDYFLECVLPADWDLNDLVSYALWYDEEDEDELPSTMKRCAECQKPFVFASNRQKYCNTCQQIVRRRQSAQRVRKYRA